MQAFLFAGLAVLVTCLLHFSSLSAVLVLVAGAVFEAAIFPFNLGRHARPRATGWQCTAI